MMTGNELESMMRQITYCTEGCENEPGGCPSCKGRIPLSDFYRLLKSHGQVIGALETLKGVLEIYEI